MEDLAYATTILHARNTTREDIEAALTALFAAEGRPCALRLEGTFSAVLARVTDPDLDAAYRYLVCRPHPASAWVPLLELGNRTEGLEVELSRALDGAAVFTTMALDADVSGYRLARGGALVDSYLSDPTYFAADDVPAEEIEAQRGRPDRFADLLPKDTSPEDFTRVVLRPGWWEEFDTEQAHGHDAAEDAGGGPAGVEAQGALVDERDRMRCIALALELWGPTEYPFAQPPGELPNKLVGPAIALAYR